MIFYGSSENRPENIMIDTVEVFGYIHFKVPGIVTDELLCPQNGPVGSLPFSGGAGITDETALVHRFQYPNQGMVHNAVAERSHGDQAFLGFINGKVAVIAGNITAAFKKFLPGLYDFMSSEEFNLFDAVRLQGKPETGKLYSHVFFLKCFFNANPGYFKTICFLYRRLRGGAVQPKGGTHVPAVIVPAAAVRHTGPARFMDLYLPIRNEFFRCHFNIFCNFFNKKG